MLFNSLTFLVFFAVVFGAFWTLRGWSARKNLLLLSSYVFYAAWDPPYLLVLFFSTSLDWWLARRIDRSADATRRRIWLLTSIAANLLLLAYFKYGAFLLDNLQSAAAVAGIDYRPAGWNLVLPIGISFYTFASLSYTLDVYRRHIRADCSLRDYALFVGFFPHLVAGPIVRASVLLPQIAHPKTPSARHVQWGLVLVVIGLFCKTVLADHLFAPVVDTVFAQPQRFGTADTWAAVLAFSGQIYFDFSAYSLCAIGLALCFGFAFPDNFRFPYAAIGIADFWRRWHISLSTWLRDYLYIPLGGNRYGFARTQFALLLTMLVGGLWHGASWLFVLWGGLHGFYLAVGRMMPRSVGDARTPAIRIAAMLATFLVVTLTWIPFRAESLGQAGQVLRGLFGAWNRANAATSQPALVWAAVAAMLVWQGLMRDRSLEEFFARLSSSATAVILVACLIGIFLFSGGDERAFLYFQF